MNEDFRVKYYSKYDMASGYELKRADVIFEKIIDSSYSCNSINDVLELHNIKKYIDEDLQLPEWDDKAVNQRKQITRGFPAIIGNYMKNISAKEFNDYFSQIHWQYYDDFWEVFSKYKVYNNIDSGSFEQFLGFTQPDINYILRQKDIVNYYDKELRRYLLSNSINAEIIIRKYLTQEGKTIFVPNSLTPNDKALLVEQYIDNSQANINYISLLATSMSNANKNELVLSDELRLKAKKRAKKIWDTHFSENKGIKIGAEILFESGIKDDILLDASNPFEVKITYNKDWIYDNLDYPTLLNNFIYLFGYVDSSFHSVFPSFPNQLSVFERITGVKGSKEYIAGVAFSQREMLTTLQMRGYRNVLKEKKIHIENLIEWFFNTYLKNEFSISGFSFYPPSNGTSYAEKNKLLASCIDSILKRFKMYVNNGEIDEELFLMSSNSVSFSDIPSLINGKYAYCNSDNLRSELNILFSDQSLLAYVPKYKNKYSSAASLFLQEHVKLDDYKGNRQLLKNINWLVERGTIYIANGEIVVCKPRYLLLSDLWNNEVICVHRRNKFQIEIDSLICSGDLILENTLFSRSEQNYLNYILNHSEYSNGLDLRNKYIHDSITRKDDVDEANYDVFLKIWILILIKINDDLCYVKP